MTNLNKIWKIWESFKEKTIRLMLTLELERISTSNRESESSNKIFKDLKSKTTLLMLDKSILHKLPICKLITPFKEWSTIKMWTKHFNKSTQLLQNKSKSNQSDMETWKKSTSAEEKFRLLKSTCKSRDNKFLNSKFLIRLKKSKTFKSQKNNQNYWMILMCSQEPTNWKDLISMPRPPKKYPT